MISHLTRSLRRHKRYFAINLTGLILGISASVFIAVFIHHELTYDQHFDHSERTYRVALNRVYPSNEVGWASIPAPISETISASFPEVEASTRMAKAEVTVSKGDKLFKEKRVLYVDPNFFEVFNLSVEDGSLDGALDQPHQVVLTESAALKYFRSTSVAGNLVTINDSLSYRVAAVVKDVPDNTHFTADLMLPMMDSFEPGVANVWGGAFFFFTYIRLPEYVDASGFELKARNLLLEKMAENEAGMDFQKWIEDGNSYDYYLQPLEDIHLYSDLQWEFMPNSNVSTVHLFLAIGIFLILITTVNYVNLTTARAGKRMKELGLRKVLGASRRHLVIQLLNESMILTLVSAFIALLMVLYFRPWFEDLSGVGFGLKDLLNPYFLVALTGGVMFIGLLAGLYPAIKMSKVYPVKAISSSTKGVSDLPEDRWVRNLLVGFQFSISFTVIMATLIVSRQNEYLSNMELGYNKHNLVVVENAQDLRGQHQSFKDELLGETAIRKGFVASAAPGFVQSASTFSPPGGENDPVNMSMMFVGLGFVDGLELELVSGRPFRESDFQDSIVSCMLNEEAAKRLGWTSEEANLQRLVNTNGGNGYSVVGVIKDFHIQSLKEKIRPLMVRANDRFAGKVIFRVESEKKQEALGLINDTWERFSPEKPIEYTFLDDNLQQLYKAEKDTQALFTIFSLLAVVIAGFGMYGLSAYLTELKRKQMAIRKTLGATAFWIFQYFTWRQLKVILVALLVGVPLSYYLGLIWLENYAYRIDIRPGMFLLAGTGVLIIGIVSIIWYTGRAALENPVNSLRE